MGLFNAIINRALTSLLWFSLFSPLQSRIIYKYPGAFGGLKEMKLLFPFFNLLIRERERKREIDWLSCSFMHSLFDFCMCPDWARTCNLGVSLSRWHSNQLSYLTRPVIMSMVLYYCEQLWNVGETLSVLKNHSNIWFIKIQLMEFYDRSLEITYLSFC